MQLAYCVSGACKQLSFQLFDACAGDAWQKSRGTAPGRQARLLRFSRGKREASNETRFKLDASLVQGKTGEMWTWNRTQPLAMAGQKGLAAGAGLKTADMPG